jgi:hypothetical protein
MRIIRDGGAADVRMVREMLEMGATPEIKKGIFTALTP